VAIEVAGFERYAPFGVGDDVLSQSVAMPLAGAEHGEDEELDRFERKELVGVARHGVLGSILNLSIVDTGT
jgi:hypothetical protein